MLILLIQREKLNKYLISSIKIKELRLEIDLLRHRCLVIKVVNK